MESGESRSLGWTRFWPPVRRRRIPATWLGLVLGLLTGCAVAPPRLDHAVRAENGAAARNSGVAENYLVNCPDVLEVAVVGRTDLTGRQPIRTDGRISLGSLDPLRVEGQTTAEIARAVADRAAVPVERVRVAVAEHHSQHIYLYGEGTGLQRAVAYRGQETVLDLLQRVGGITAGAAPSDVHVIRSHVAEGKPPEVFKIDLEAIVVKKDQRTNLRLQPFDQVYIGETRSSSLAKCFPHWMQPLYEALCGLEHDVLAK